MKCFHHFVFIVIVSICVHSIPVGKFLSILDKSLVYQLTHPTTNVNSVRFLIEDLRAYKENLLRITKRVGMGRGYVMEHAKNLSLSRAPAFLENEIDFGKLQKSFNLSESQVADIRILISQIKVNWDEFLKVSNSTDFKSDTLELPFFLIEKAGNNIAEFITKPTPNVTSKLFTDLSNYYYGLGKLLKLFKSNQNEMFEKCRSMYDQEKPIFLRRYVNFLQLKNSFQMDDMQCVDFKRWISKILFRWKIFMGFYESNKNLTGQPNLNNYNHLVSTDNELRDIMCNPIPQNFKKFIDLLDSFFQTLGLIMRNNYPFRENIIRHVAATYMNGPPLFLRKYINFKHLKESFVLNEESFYQLRKKIFNIKNRWERLNIVAKPVVQTTITTSGNKIDETTNSTV
ncbi:hypothetical protein J6590_031681 [Homalodisca vitripennis]|uniref:Angiotensin-converting enzyme n=1 Tax=Homalodisca liturata TaxID=320908 RepID=A0A1B6IA14_9HEMI|nr:hypothetical protein J6590_031681 [Homalodisca vitripennis]